ncbi:MAG: hypothetical protein RL062_1497 [Bacteroidota bacterium]
MKNLVTLLIMFCSMTFAAFGQKTEVPVNVTKAFQEKFSNTKKIEWEYDSEEKNWEVEYKIGKDEFTAEFDENGIWVETEMEIKFSKLPESVKAALKADFAEYKVEEVVWVEKPDGKFYEVEVELEKRGQELEFEILFSLDGKIISKKTENEDKE